MWHLEHGLIACWKARFVPCVAFRAWINSLLDSYACVLVWHLYQGGNHCLAIPLSTANQIFWPIALMCYLSISGANVEVVFISDLFSGHKVNILINIMYV